MRVEAAAMVMTDGKIVSLPRPARHHDIMRYCHEVLKYPKPVCGKWSGFILSNGKYVGRIEAKIIAKKANQLLDRASKLEELFSEDVW